MSAEDIVKHLFALRGGLNVSLREIIRDIFAGVSPSLGAQPAAPSGSALPTNRPPGVYRGETAIWEGPLIIGVNLPGGGTITMWNFEQTLTDVWASVRDSKPGAEAICASAKGGRTEGGRTVITRDAEGAVVIAVGGEIFRIIPPAQIFLRVQDKAAPSAAAPSAAAPNAAAPAGESSGSSEEALTVGESSGSPPATAPSDPKKEADSLE